MKMIEEKRIDLLLRDLLSLELENTKGIINSSGFKLPIDNGQFACRVGSDVIDINLDCRKSIKVHKKLIDQVLIDYAEMLENKIKELEEKLNG